MNSWQKNLRQILNRLQLNNPAPRIGIVGIGNEFRGDDAAGIFLVRRLASSLHENEALLIVDAGPAPENYTSLLRRFVPDLVILIDAADMVQLPGSIQLVPWHDLTGLSASTHSLPLDLFAKYLEQELKCEILFLGIQPVDTRMNAELHSEVRLSVERASLDLITLISAFTNKEYIPQESCFEISSPQIAPTQTHLTRST